jgi:hypothetical protein
MKQLKTPQNLRLTKILSSSLLAAFLLVGCGSGDETTVIVPAPPVTPPQPIQPEPELSKLPNCSDLENLAISVDTSEYVINYMGGIVNLNAIVYKDNSEISAISYHYEDNKNTSQEIATVYDYRGSSFSGIETKFSIEPNKTGKDIEHVFEIKQYCVKDTQRETVTVLAGGFTQKYYDKVENALDEINGKVDNIIDIVGDINSNITIILDENLNPIADAGQNIQVTLGETVSLIGNGQDLDGDIIKYRWYLNDRLIKSTKEITFKPKLGISVLRLEVQDDKGGKGYDTVIIDCIDKDVQIPNYCSLTDPITSFDAAVDKTGKLPVNGSVVKIDLAIFSEDCLNNFIIEHKVDGKTVSADTKSLTRESIDNRFIHFSAGYLIGKNITGKDKNHDFIIYYYKDNIRKEVDSINIIQSK